MDGAFQRHDFDADLTGNSGDLVRESDLAVAEIAMIAPHRTVIRWVAQPRILVPVIAALCVFDFAHAETPTTSGPTSAIEIKIETSRLQPTAGTGLGVAAEIRNTSKSPVYLHEKHVTLTLPPELENLHEQTGWWALFPTELNDPKDPFNNTISLKPGDSYKVFWTRDPSGTRNGKPRSFLLELGRQVFSQLDFVFFSPGEYKITIVAKYWLKASRSRDDYRTVTQSTTLQVAAPQFVILLGAAIGGLIAYFIMPQARRRLVGTGRSPGVKVRLFGQRVVVEGAGILGSVLLSAIITILLSRISETQFLIRVTITDFWGAIAIGFVANYAGVKILDKILSQSPPAKDGRSPAAAPGSGGATQPGQDKRDS